MVLPQKALGGILLNSMRAMNTAAMCMPCICAEQGERCHV